MFACQNIVREVFVEKISITVIVLWSLKAVKSFFTNSKNKAKLMATNGLHGFVLHRFISEQTLFKQTPDLSAAHIYTMC